MLLTFGGFGVIHRPYRSAKPAETGDLDSRPETYRHTRSNTFCLRMQVMRGAADLQTECVATQAVPHGTAGRSDIYRPAMLMAASGALRKGKGSGEGLHLGPGSAGHGLHLLRVARLLVEALGHGVLDALFLQAGAVVHLWRK